MALTLSEFMDSGRSLKIFLDNEAVFESKDSDLIPLISYLKQRTEQVDNLTVYDKYVGRAAALLMVLIRPRKVFAGVVSEGGAAVLRENEIPLEAGREVKYLMEIASQGMCRWEKAAVGKSPEEWWDAIKQMKDQNDENN